jgi:RecA/RadA recombinase
MSERKLIVSFGSGKQLENNKQLAIITAVSEATWQEFADLLVKQPPETEDKASRGWFCPSEFSPRHRHGANLVLRHALTLDYDRITPADLQRITASLAPYAHVVYTTWSHTKENPRIRVVMPTDRPMDATEFCAVSRWVANLAGIELAARESHKPAQMMFQPTRKPGAKFFAKQNAAPWLNVDEVLATYEDWTDHTSWPKCATGDEQYDVSELPPAPSTKPGIVGEFCRAFDVPAAIERFELPYVPTNAADRYTFTHGSRPEGAVLYDDGQKLHSHHDSDPAHGQHNAYDLVRLHRFGELDKGVSGELASLPSSKAMAEFARSLPEIQKAQAADEFEVLGPLTTEEEELASEAKKPRFRVIPAEEFAVTGQLAWIIKKVLPKAELVVLYGESGAGKSFLALDLAAAVSRGVDWQELKTLPGRVVYVCAEGAGGFKNRLQAYARDRDTELASLPAVVPDAPNLLELEHVLDLTRAIVEKGRADLIVIDTLAATTAGGNENSGEDMGKVIAHCKKMHKATGALILLIHHSGKDAAKGARGWSGLKAAADAEIEVTRNGDFRTVRLSKMKDGADSIEWTFKLNTVVLGMDDDGDEISSCVIEFVAPEEKKAADEPVGARQRMLLRTIEDIEVLKGDCFISELLDEAVKKTPLDATTKRDYRRKTLRTALQWLLDNGYAHLKGEDRVSTSSAVRASPEDFEKAPA